MATCIRPVTLCNFIHCFPVHVGIRTGCGWSLFIIHYNNFQRTPSTCAKVYALKIGIINVQASSKKCCGRIMGNNEFCYNGLICFLSPL